LFTRSRGRSNSSEIAGLLRAVRWSQRHPDELEKYSEHGTAQFEMPEVLKMPPISEHGNVGEIIGIFGGAERLKDAVDQLQVLLYAA
jgi:hypothetical protein